MVPNCTEKLSQWVLGAPWPAQNHYCMIHFDRLPASCTCSCINESKANATHFTHGVPIHSLSDLNLHGIMAQLDALTTMDRVVFAAATKAGIEVHTDGIAVHGVPVGTDEFIREWVKKKMSDLAEDVRALKYFEFSSSNGDGAEEIVEEMVNIKKF